VLWGVVTVAAVGILLGLRFSAPALLAATAVTVTASVLFLEGRGFVQVLFLVVVLQCAYLLGLAFSLGWRRFTTK